MRLTVIGRPNIRAAAIKIKQASPSLTCKEIGAQLEVCESTVAKWLRAAEVKTADSRHYPTDTKQRAIAMKRSDPLLSNKTIGDRLGVGESTVSGWLRSAS